MDAIDVSLAITWPIGALQMIQDGLGLLDDSRFESDDGKGYIVLH